MAINSLIIILTFDRKARQRFLESLAEGRRLLVATNPAHSHSSGSGPGFRTYSWGKPQLDRCLLAYENAEGARIPYE